MPTDLKEAGIFRLIYRRFKDLCVKLISVKGTFALIGTVNFFNAPSSMPAMYLCAFAWVVFIGGREAEKFFGYLKTN